MHAYTHTSALPKKLMDACSLDHTHTLTAMHCNSVSNPLSDQPVSMALCHNYHFSPFSLPAFFLLSSSHSLPLFVPLSFPATLSSLHHLPLQAPHITINNQTYTIGWDNRGICSEIWLVHAQGGGHPREDEYAAQGVSGLGGHPIFSSHAH